MKDIPERRHPRMKHFDYSSGGMYFVTVCTYGKKPLLAVCRSPSTEGASVGRGLAPAEWQLKAYGAIAEKQLFLLEERYPHVRVDQYVIMPNHIHVTFGFADAPAGASSRPTLMDVICAFKSLTVREIRALGGTEKIFQTSFYERVIRTENEYQQILRYIAENPDKWWMEPLYTE